MAKLNPSDLQIQRVTACYSYFQGLYDASMLSTNAAAKDTKKLKKFHFLGSSCPPIKVSRNQLILIYVKHISEHPEKLHEPALLTVGYAIKEVFPCK